MTGRRIHLVECPRDAMQGWSKIIPTQKKIEYINALLQVGFDTLDFGSFVSAKVIPQMADTEEVLSGLDLSGTHSKLLAIVANQRGASEAVTFDSIHFLGFPFSLSETFQLRNTNSSMKASLVVLQEMLNTCAANNKKLVVYLSMGFGNPYGDPYSEELVCEWADKLVGMGVEIISVADTVGLADAHQVSRISRHLVNAHPGTQIGVHLHSSSHNREAKIEAAMDAGCTRFDGALKGIGGCPMAGDILVGNIDTEWLIGYFNKHYLLAPVNEMALQKSLRIAGEIFI
ncbi:MAG: hydroxymethylglutaryl-CoA lyase [Chitinophagaceae bacterium]